eukprot:9656214-Alexandrium_andersonii.AAC.1
MLTPEARSSLELGTVQLRRELQARSGFAGPFSHNLRVHAWVVDAHVRAAPARARWAAHEEAWALSPQQAGNGTFRLGRDEGRRPRRAGRPS